MAKLSLFKRAFPQWALKREFNKMQLQQLASRTYDAVTESQYHLRNGNRHSADAVMQHATDTLRNEARWLDENHDLVIGVLDELQNNIVGKGIKVEPLIKGKDGKLNEKVNASLRRLWDEFCRAPEVTTTMDMNTMQRLACRSWLRDGDIFAHHVEGRRFAHTPTVQYNVELLEADFLPFNHYFDQVNENIIHGVEKDAWGKPLNYYFFKQHPGDVFGINLKNFNQDTKRVPAQDISHLKFTRRLHQTRGVTILHGVLHRLQDIKDYEESERIAARIAASFTAAIKREGGSGSAYTQGNRSDLEMQAGMIFHLQPGEDVATIDTNRPNTGLNDFRSGQVRMVSAGTGTKNSAISRDYNGTYSAQRQELIESRVGYESMRDQFVAQFLEPIYRRFVENAITFGALRTQSGVDPETLFDAEYRGPGMPWIDPLKEAKADEIKIQSRITSRHQLIKDRGGDPAKVDEQIARERESDMTNGYVCDNNQPQKVENNAEA